MLELASDFSSWIKYRIESRRFVENRDYIIVTTSGDNSGAGRKFIEYYLTLDAAKALAMLENNEVGDKVREYFISAEKQLHQRLSQLPENQ